MNGWDCYDHQEWPPSRFYMAQVSKKTINVGGRQLDLSEPMVMGIVNCTPDSFYKGSRVDSDQALMDRVGMMQRQGARFIDVGGYSTRPGAEVVSAEMEIERVASVIAPLKKFFPDLIISVDTFRSEVARVAVREGAEVINDVSGGDLDPNMFDTVAELGVPYVLMHMRGTPETMAGLTHYEHLVMDIIKELKRKMDILRSKGVGEIWIDPGFGFAKTIAQNFELLGQMSEFKLLGCPILVGLSRKATIYKTLKIQAEDALNGTTVLNTIGLSEGASILRVHDVREAVEAVKLWKATRTMN